MARVLCYHGKYYLNPENSTYVKDGVPMCHEWTCEKVKEHRKRETCDLSRVIDGEESCLSP